MDYKNLEGKRIFGETNGGRRIRGKVIHVDTSKELNGLVFIEVEDKNGKEETFVHSEFKILREVI